MPDNEPTRLLPTTGQQPRTEKNPHPAVKQRQPIPTPVTVDTLPPEDSDIGLRVILFSTAAVISLGVMLAVITSTRDTGARNAVTNQMVYPDPVATTSEAPSNPAIGPASTSLVPSATPSVKRRPTSTAASRSQSPAADPTRGLTVGATIGLEVAGKPGLRLHHQQPTVRVDPLSSASNVTDRAGSRFVVRKGLGFADCVSFEAVSNPGFYLRRFFADLVLHKRDGSPVFDQEATFCPKPTADGKAFVLVVRFPAGFVVVASPDGLLHLDAPDLTTRTAFVVQKPL